MCMQKLFCTNKFDTAALVVRLAGGGIMLPHGLAKAGLIVAPGNGFIEMMTQGGMPYVVALLVVIAELVGAASLIIGFMTRFCAASLALVMAGAILMVHWQGGFFAPAGYEYPLTLLLVYITSAIRGGGRWSVDSVLCHCGKCCS